MKLLCLAIAFALVGTSIPLPAQAAIKHYQLSIPRQSLDSALKEFAKQTGLQVARFTDTGATADVGPLDGKLTVEQALRALLAESGLTWRMVNERTIAVESARRADEGPMRLAQAENNSQSGSSQSDSDKKDAEDPNSKVSSETLEEIDLKGIPEIVVKGRKTLNADIRRTEDDPQPYVVFGAEEVKQSNASNLEEFFKTRLPMNTVQGTASQSANLAPGNQSSINLRGLGANQTLILVDGRRMPSVLDFGAFGQPDINGIPLAAIERIEVLPSTASGIYGGGATGGVINIITRKDYAGVDASLSYGNTSRADAGNYRVDVSTGLNLLEGRTHILAAASRANADVLSVGERDFATGGRALQFANDSTAFYTLTTPPQGSTSNIRSQNGSNLVLKNGTPLNSPRTFVPVGYAGPAADSGAALVANAGRYNLDLPNTVGGARQNLVNNPTVTSATVNVRHQFTPRIEGIADFAWFDNQGHSFSATIPSSTVLQISAPNNPFDTPIVVAFPATGMSYELRSQRETMRATGGAIMRLPRNWTASADYVWSRARSDIEFTFPVIGDPDGPGSGGSGTAALSSGTLNVMSDLNEFPLNWTPYLLPSPNSSRQFDTVLGDATVRLSGPWLQLPGGPLTTSSVLERRKETAEAGFQVGMNANAGATATYFPSRSQSVMSYYLETRVPFVSKANERMLLRDLELQASVRRDEYETRAPSPGNASVPSPDGPLPALTYSTNESNATKFTVGLRYVPVEDLTLRASYGTGFLPPSINQIVPGGPLVDTTSLIDPKRGNVAATVTFTDIFFGNPNLEAEESESWSAGAIFTPRWLPDLRLSLDYTRIEKSNEITSLDFQTTLNLEDFLRGRVTRAPLTLADQQLGYTGGIITFMDITFLNVSETQLQAYDLQADYTWRTQGAGNFQLYTLITRQPQFERRTAPNTPFVESVGFNTGVLEWRGNVGLTWERGPWTVGWNGQYYDSYFVYASTASAATRASAARNQGSATIPSQTYHDLFARYRFDSGRLGGTEVTLGIQNVLDEAPPILATTAAVGGYSTFGDPRLQRFMLTLRTHF